MGTLYFELSSAIALKGIPWQSSGQDSAFSLPWPSSIHSQGTKKAVQCSQKKKATTKKQKQKQKFNYMAEKLIFKNSLAV